MLLQHKLLKKALRLRQEQGDLHGADLTQHHLDLKLHLPKTVSSPTDLPSPKPTPPTPRPSPLWRKVLLPTSIAGLAGMGILIGLRLATSSQPNIFHDPVADPSTSPLVAPSSSSKPEPSPTPVLDPFIPDCVAADVERNLPIRPDPNSGAQDIGILAPKEQATTTKKRQGDFLEISTPVKGWIHKKFAQSCNSEKFVRAPQLVRDPSISNCVAADVKNSLSIRSQPYFNIDPVRKLAPRDKATTTQMRHGNFIEISAPVKCWVYDGKAETNEHYTIPCGGTFVRAPEQNNNLPTSTPPLTNSSPSLPEDPHKQVKIYKGQWSSDEVQGVQATVNKIARFLDPDDSGRDLLTIDISINNQTNESFEFNCFHNDFYVQDNLKRIYSYRSCPGSIDNIIIPSSDSVTGFASGIFVDSDTSSISINFSIEGRNLSIRNILIDRNKGANRTITGVTGVYQR